MENRIQPILCCVGADVAGEPTQFLMERAVAAAHLDWHVITVEVSGDQLDKAWQGMDIMGFQAIRFFPTHQAAALQLVTEPTEDNLFIGGITSALRTGSQWSVWHNSGPALHELLASRVAWKDAIVWLHGDGPKIRSLLLACKSSPPRHIVWSGSDWQLPGELASTPAASQTEAAAESSAASNAVESAQPSLAVAVEPDEKVATRWLPEHVANALSIEILPPAREPELVELLTSQLAGTATVSALVYFGPDNPRHIDVITASQPGHDCALTIVSSAPGSRRKLNELWRAGAVHVLTQADLIVAEEAYDQTRWTGAPANIELLREAYEEYADF